MHAGNVLLLVAALPLAFGVAAYFAWGRGLRHGLLYAVFVTITYAFCQEVVAGVAAASFAWPADAHAAIRQALVSRVAGTLFAAVAGTLLAWKLRRAMVPRRAVG